MKPYHQSALESAKTKLCLFRKPRATISENKVPIKQIIMFILKFTANMCREITVKVHLENCNFEKLQFFTADHSSLCFLPVKNCNFSIIFNVVYFALN